MLLQHFLKIDLIYKSNFKKILVRIDYFVICVPVFECFCVPIAFALISSKNELARSPILWVVRMRGVEPPHLSAPDPKSGVSANFTYYLF